MLYQVTYYYERSVVNARVSEEVLEKVISGLVKSGAEIIEVIKYE